MQSMLARTVGDIERVLARGNLPPSQIAKLYGFTEKLLMTKVDNMATSGEGLTELEGKGLRKDLVRRCNALLDSLEKERDKHTDNDDVLVDERVAVGANLMEDGELQLGVAFSDYTTLMVSATKLAGDLATSAQSSLQLLLTNGFISSLASVAVIASDNPTPLSVLRAAEEEQNSGLPRRYVHTHAAAALGLANLFPDSLGVYMFVSFSTKVFQFSVIRITSTSGDSSGEVEFLLHRQHQILTKGSTTSLLSSASVLVPYIQDCLRNCGNEELRRLDGIILCSGGSTTNSMYKFIKVPLQEAFPGTPLVTPFLDSAFMTDTALNGIRLERDFIAFGASIVAAGLLETAESSSSLKTVTSKILNEPVGCFIGIRTRLHPSTKSSVSITEDETAVSDNFEDLFSAIPFYTPCAAVGISVEKLLSVMRCNWSKFSTDPAVTMIHNPAFQESLSDQAVESLAIEIVQIEIGRGGSAIACLGWDSGVVQNAVLDVSKEPPGRSRLNGLKKGPFQYSVIGRCLIKPPIINTNVASDMIELMRMRLKLLVTISREVTIELETISLDAEDCLSGQVERFVCDGREMTILAEPPNLPNPSAKKPSIFYLADPSEAEITKTRGNTLLKRAGGVDEYHVINQAVVAYSLALQYDPLNAVYYSNRCAARLKAVNALRNKRDSFAAVDLMYTQCLHDAKVCTILRPFWSKGHSRLGEVLYRQNKLEEAFFAYSKAYDCEIDETRVAQASRMESATSGTGVNSGSSSILQTLNEVKSAWDLQVATAAALEAENQLKHESEESIKKRKKAENEKSNCVLSHSVQHQMNAQLDGIITANPFVKGVLCADSNGLCISAKGELTANCAGRYTAIARLANSLNDDISTRAPTVLIETNTRSILVKDYDALTMAIKCVSGNNR